MFTVYLIKCHINNKSYIGQTSRSLELRFQEHINCANNGKTTCRKLYAAIRKYKSENFSIEKLDEAFTQTDIDRLEIIYIEQFDSIKNGYNLQIGGYNGLPSTETKLLMSKQHLGEKNAMYGKHHTDTAKQIISMKKKGSSSYWKNKSLPQETKEKISISRKGLTVGENNPGAKLTLQQVKEIKLLLQESNLTRQQIADKFSVSLSSIKRIKTGFCWKDE